MILGSILLLGSLALPSTGCAAVRAGFGSWDLGIGIGLSPAGMVAGDAGSDPGDEVAFAPLPGGKDRSREEAPLSDEDREVMENLELLEELEAAGDLDLLLELSGGDDDEK